MLPGVVLAEGRPIPQWWLYRCDDHSQFAYARVRDFYRCSDDMPWAHLANRWLISARSGRRLAYQMGSVFYDVDTDEPVYLRLRREDVGAALAHGLGNHTDAHEEREERAPEAEREDRFERRGDRDHAHEHAGRA